MDLLLVGALFFGALDSSLGLRFCSFCFGSILRVCFLAAPFFSCFKEHLPSYSGFRHLQAFDIFMEQAGFAGSLVYEFYTNFKFLRIGIRILAGMTLGLFGLGGFGFGFGLLLSFLEKFF